MPRIGILTVVLLILAPTAGQAALVQIPNYAALRSADYSGQTRLHLAGRLHPGDGGEGDFVATSGSCQDDDGLFLRDQAGHCYRRETGEKTGFVSILWFGADPTGHGDSADAIRKAIAAGNDIYFPSGHYLLASTQPSPFSYYDPPAILVSDKHDFHIRGNAAAITVADAIAFSEQFLFYRCHDFSVTGLRLTGNRAGLHDGDENGAIALASVVHASFSNLSLDGDWRGAGAGFIGDWIADTKFSNIQMTGMGFGFDAGYLQNVTLTGIRARGKGYGGAAGQRFLGLVQNKLTKGDNQTGVVFSRSNRIQIVRNTISGFNTGISIASGNDITIEHNVVTGNSGSHAIAGIGILLSPVSMGQYASDNDLPSNIQILDNQILANGQTFPGYGIFIDAGTTTGQLENVVIRGNTIANNRNTGLGSTGTHIRGLVIESNTIRRSEQQQTTIDSHTIVGLFSPGSEPSVRIQDNAGFNPYGDAAQRAMPNGTGAARQFINQFAFPLRITIPAQAEPYEIHIRNAAGSQITDEIVNRSWTGILQPNDAIYFLLRVPDKWRLSGL